MLFSVRHLLFLLVISILACDSEGGGDIDRRVLSSDEVTQVLSNMTFVIFDKEGDPVIFKPSEYFTNLGQGDYATAEPPNYTAIASPTFPLFRSYSLAQAGQLTFADENGKNYLFEFESVYIADIEVLFREVFGPIGYQVPAELVGTTVAYGFGSAEQGIQNLFSEEGSSEIQSFVQLEINPEGYSQGYFYDFGLTPVFGDLRGQSEVGFNNIQDVGVIKVTASSDGSSYSFESKYELSLTQ